MAHLGLFALAIQLVVTFGHVHLNALPPLTAADTAQSTGVEKASAASTKADSKNQKSHGTADNDCPICALIQLASTSTPSVAPALPVPTTVEGAILEAAAATDFAAPRVFAFQARGPPTI
ncbi:MAG TPA: DUF2946 family protein [Pseudolabrys sp.]|nr:DUF2946 family protein [Pseudolabrys sp.]